MDYFILMEFIQTLPVDQLNRSSKDVLTHPDLWPVYKPRTPQGE